MSHTNYSSMACLDHITGDTHPEHPNRLHAIIKHLGASLTMRTGDTHTEQSNQAILRAHSSAYWSHVTNQNTRTGSTKLDEDTVYAKGTHAALMDCTTILTHAVADILNDQTKAQTAFCALRPPGHHAGHDFSMGFCITNGVMIAALHALSINPMMRIAIVDFDVHHGNGTQHIHQQLPSQLSKQILFASIQEAQLWPYNDAEHINEGTIVNVPIARDSDASVWMDKFNQIIIPAVDAFCPELIIISAGFDAHHDDPPKGILFNDPPACQHLLDNDYAAMTQSLKSIANTHASGRILSVLEGGYNPAVLAKAVDAHIKALSDTL